MWWTNSGERTLRGAEARLFAEVLLDLLDEVNLNDQDDYAVGIGVFDRLTYGQKISVLSVVGNGLLTEDVPTVKLSAVWEGAIAAVYEHLKISIAVEIEEPEFGTDWRKQVVWVRKEQDGEEIPSPSCEDLEEWDLEIESLKNTILWDADYEDEDLFVDDSPERAEMLKRLAGIRSDYYAEIAEDLKTEEIDERLEQIRKLCYKTMTNL